MMVQELIDELNKIEDKSKIVSIYQEEAYEPFDIFINEYKDKIELS